MALYISLGQNWIRMLNVMMVARALLFFQTFPPFIFSSFWQWRFSWGAFFSKIELHGAFNRVRMCVVWFLCSTFCLFQIRRQLESCCTFNLLIAPWIQTVYLMHPSVYSYCIFLFHMFNRTGILNHKAVSFQFSISYETLKAKAKTKGTSLNTVLQVELSSH